VRKIGSSLITSLLPHQFILYPTMISNKYSIIKEIKHTYY